MNGDMINSRSETEPLLHSHEHHRILQCSCLPKLLFNCCFLVSWTCFTFYFLNFFTFIPKKVEKHLAEMKAGVSDKKFVA
jgi:hypothetical protein